MGFPIPLILHFTCMGIAALLFAAAVLIAFRKQGNAWLKKHRAAALAGVTLLLAGAVIMIIHKISKNYPHFKSPHSISGLITLLSALTNPVLGFLILKGNNKLKPVHKIIGRTVVVLAILTAAFGAAMILS